MTMMWGFQILQRPINNPAATARILAINMPLTLREAEKTGWGFVPWHHSSLTLGKLKIFFFHYSWIISSMLVISLFYSLTFLSGLPQIPPGRRTTSRRWRRLPPTMTNTWSHRGDVPPRSTLLHHLCCFLKAQQPSLTTLLRTAHNAFQWPTAHDMFMVDRDVPSQS